MHVHVRGVHTHTHTHTHTSKHAKNNVLMWYDMYKQALYRPGFVFYDHKINALVIG